MAAASGWPVIVAHRGHRLGDRVACNATPDGGEAPAGADPFPHDAPHHLRVAGDTLVDVTWPELHAVAAQWTIPTFSHAVLLSSSLPSDPHLDGYSQWTVRRTIHRDGNRADVGAWRKVTGIDPDLHDRGCHSPGG